LRIHALRTLLVVPVVLWVPVILGAEVTATGPELTDSGKLRPVVSEVFPLRQGREAFASGTRPHPPGKTVLRVR
jgi:hypothetical protein